MVFHAFDDLAVLADVALWIGGVVIGFALLYLPVLDDFAYSSSVPFGAHNAFEALYASGLVAFTIGFRDIVGATDPLSAAAVLSEHPPSIKRTRASLPAGPSFALA